jgi:hypothetical protein
MLFGMNPWAFVVLFAVLLTIGEFLSRRSVAAVVASLPPEERTLSSRRHAAVRVARFASYAVIVAGTVAYGLDSDLARGVLGVMFLVTAVGALLSVISLVSSRARK